MKFTWTKLHGVFVCVKVSLGSTRQETMFWIDGAKTFAVKDTSRR